MANQNEILNIIDNGLKLEDQISELYYKVTRLRSQLIEKLSPEDQKKFLESIEILIIETKKHSKYLEEIKDELIK